MCKYCYCCVPARPSGSFDRRSGPGIQRSIWNMERKAAEPTQTPAGAGKVQGQKLEQFHLDKRAAAAQPLGRCRGGVLDGKLPYRSPRSPTQPAACVFVRRSVARLRKANCWLAFGLLPIPTKSFDRDSINRGVRSAHTTTKSNGHGCVRTADCPGTPLGCGIYSHGAHNSWTRGGLESGMDALIWWNQCEKHSTFWPQPVQTPSCLFSSSILLNSVRKG